jgi:hypothetical protein
MSVLEENGNVKLLGLDWDTWGVKVVGNIGVLGNSVTVRKKIGLMLEVQDHLPDTIL